MFSNSRLESRLHDQINLGVQPAFEVLTEVQKVKEVDVAIEGHEYTE